MEEEKRIINGQIDVILELKLKAYYEEEEDFFDIEIPEVIRVPDNVTIEIGEQINESETI